MTAAATAGKSDGRKPRWRDLARLLPHAGTPVLLGVVGVAIIDALLPLAVIATTGRLIDRVTTAPSLGAVQGPLILLALLFGIRQILEPICTVVVYLAASRIDGRLGPGR